MQGGTGADHAQDVGVVFPVERQRRGHDLHFADIASGEERADGAVDEPAGQDFLGGGPAFAFDEAAGELAGGIGLLTIIDRERKEISDRIGAAFDGRGQGDGVAIATTTAPWACLASLPVSRTILERRGVILHDMPARYLPHLQTAGSPPKGGLVPQLG